MGDKQLNFRPTEDDLKILAALKNKLGLRHDSDVIRQALRCLKDKEGLK
jgi:hypothetical protein